MKLLARERSPKAPTPADARLGMRPWLGRLVGPTPTLPLADPETGCTIWVKLEYLLPSGSTKDRVASFIIARAIESGELHGDSLVVEASSGSTSIAFAMACALVGVRFRAVMPAGVSGERVLIIRRYGGEVVLTPAHLGVGHAIEETRRMAAADPRVFLPRQFENPLNVLAHKLVTGPELLTQVGVPIDGFVAGVGTGGTLMGIGRALREIGHRTAIARVIPDRGGRLLGEPEVCGGIPGVVEGLSSILDGAAIGLGEDIRLSDAEAIRATRELCARGLAVGPSSGLNFAGARVLARRLGPGHHVATVLSDRMERYFSTDLFRDLNGVTDAK